MTDEERWLRPEVRRAWLGMKNSVVAVWLATPVIIGLYSLFPRGWGLTLPGGMLFCWCGPIPAWVLIKRLAYWSAHRSLAWHVDAAGVEIHRHGAAVFRYAWSQIRGIDRQNGDAVRIDTGDEWGEHLMRLVKPDDIRWFREYARDRVIERLERTTSQAKK